MVKSTKQQKSNKMNPEELLRYIMRKVKQVNEIATTRTDVYGLGYAIVIPEGTGEEATRTVDRELISLIWELERVTIQGKEYYVLFP